MLHNQVEFNSSLYTGTQSQEIQKELKNMCMYLSPGCDAFGQLQQLSQKKYMIPGGEIDTENQEDVL